MNNRNITPWIAAFFALALSVACEPLNDLVDEPDINEDPCQSANGPAPVDGIWVITGNGQRTECSNDDLNNDFSLASNGNLVVKQDDDTLSLNGTIDGFSFTGTVDGICVNFTTIEETNGPDLSYSWSGKVNSDGSITGTFTGTGPSDCASNGSFTAIVQ